MKSGQPTHGNFCSLFIDDANFAVSVDEVTLGDNVDDQVPDLDLSTGP